MRPFDRQPESVNTWLWIFAVTLTLMLFVGVAMAGTATVAFREGGDTDLVRCRITLQNAQGAAIDSQEITAFNNDQVHEGVVLNFNSAALQGQTGQVVGWCVDLSGQTSVESTPFNVTFPDGAPQPPVILNVQIVP